MALDTLVRENYDKAGRSYIKVDSVFGLGMKNGHLPFRVTIRNNTGKSRVWTVRFSEENNYRSLGYHSTFQFEVENGSEVTNEVMVPIPPQFSKGYGHYRQIKVSATSPGLDKVERSDNKPTDTSDWPTIALSKKLALRSLSKLGDAQAKKTGSSSSSRKTFGYEYDAATLPSDWRGYTGLDVLMIDAGAWKKLNTGQRQAITEWLRIGGRCDIYSSTDDPFTLKETGIGYTKGTDSDKATVSFGGIRTYLWNGKELDTTVIRRYRSLKSFNKAIEGDYRDTWKLLQDFGTKNFSPVLVFILLIIFAIIVAPVNLFYFAREGKRHKLFITTPIISLAACLIIIAIIFLKDGLGGSGRRLAVVDLQSHPDEMRLYLSQEQISRTGVMFSTGFTQDEQIDITPVELPKSSWNPLSRTSGKLGNLEFAGKSFSGDFFRSRTEQGFAIRSVQSTRARIELRETGTKTKPPQLFSSLGFSVKEFHYTDDNGKAWKSPEGTQIDPGTAIPLESVQYTDFISWYNIQSLPFGTTKRNKIRGLSDAEGRFFAIAKDPKKLLISTANSIRWIDDLVIVTGFPVSSGVKKPSPKTETGTGQ